MSYLKRNPDTRSSITSAEIDQQPALWADTLERLRGHSWLTNPDTLWNRPVLCGAGTSAYAASAIAAAWPESRALPTTDLLVEHDLLRDAGVFLSIARSGSSPESVGVVDKALQLNPDAVHRAITCNAEGELARHPSVDCVLLDPRTNDRSLVMTSSFSNLVLAGLALRHFNTLSEHLPAIAERTTQRLTELYGLASELAGHARTRVVVLASRPLLGWAREACLKILEMSAGRVTVMAETYTGVRHGPLSFINRDTIVLCLLSTEAHRQPYELDLIEELRAKKLGYLVGIVPTGVDRSLFPVSFPALAPELPDILRTPFEIVFPQILAMHICLHLGLNPDSPSPSGVITRVVQGVRIHPLTEGT